MRTTGTAWRSARTSFSPFGSVARWNAGRRPAGGAPGLGPALAVGAARPRRELGERVHLEDVDAVGEPALRGVRRRRPASRPARARAACGRSRGGRRRPGSARGCPTCRRSRRSARRRGRSPARRSVFARSSSSAVGPSAQEPRELLVDRLLDRREVAARLGGGLDRRTCSRSRASPGRPRRRSRSGRRRRAACTGARSCRTRARARRGREHVVVGGAPLRRVPDLVDPRLRHAVLRASGAASPVRLRDPRLVLRDRRPGRDVAEVLLDLRLHVLGLHVAGDDEHGVRRRRSTS